MKRLPKLSVVLLLSALLIVAALLILKRYCPLSGIAFSRERREFHRLKNRTALPQLTDFDDQVTLTSLLHTGEDRMRWSSSRAARLEGYVVSVAAGPIELVNCYIPCNRDVHIHVALRPDALPREQVVLETTPRMEDWAKPQGWDWSETSLQKDFVGHDCRFEGWLFFDSPHATEAENTAPGSQNNWRATTWEIHPVTKFEIIR
ncbi:MAG: hypothetical protein M3R69_10650 [Acidobacteriota bacterium]|nr:hypothetical protein [Acidobacteriota bacterium]